MGTHKSIGELLIERNLLTEEQLQKALAEQHISKKRLGDTLISMGMVQEEVIFEILSEQMGMPFIDLNQYQVEAEVISLIDKKIAQKLEVIPIFHVEKNLTVAMTDPLDINRVDELQMVTGMEIQPVFGAPTAIRKALDTYYSSPNEFNEAIDQYHQQNTAFKNENTAVKNILEISSDNKEAQNAPAINLVNLVLTQAVRDGASDIHFEPSEHQMDIRIRIDGILHPLKPPPNELQGPILSRLKVIANLDIAEKRLPQDGRIQVSIENRHVDLRVSTFPTIYGENIVIRILDKTMGILNLDSIGLPADELPMIKKVISNPNGIILVTGPTGSGKTTSLYSFLKEINNRDKNIMTLEDPVEYRLPGIRQAHVDVKSGLTFENGLRSLLRQDPDVIMIGEIRDIVTAEIAIQAALTGHLVLSTLHTNGAAPTIARLLDMGVEPFLVSSSITAILAQRLVRKLCPECKEAYTPSEAEIQRLGIPEDNYTFYNPVGCKECRNTGYSGRIGIYELLIPSKEIRKMISEKCQVFDISNQAEKEGFKTLKDDGISRVIKGITSVSELFRAIQ